jgi:hypothetical protein
MTKLKSRRIGKLTVMFPSTVLSIKFSESDGPPHDTFEAGDHPYVQTISALASIWPLV